MSGRRDGTCRHDGHWRRVRQQVLERDGHRCRLRLPGCVGEASEVDHIIDIALGGAVLELANCRAVWAPCHRRRSSLMRGRMRRSPPAREWPKVKAPDENPHAADSRVRSKAHDGPGIA